MTYACQSSAALILLAHEVSPSRYTSIALGASTTREKHLTAYFRAVSEHLQFSFEARRHIVSGLV
jgi:hypothetical protein